MPNFQPLVDATAFYINARAVSDLMGASIEALSLAGIAGLVGLMTYKFLVFIGRPAKGGK